MNTRESRLIKIINNIMDPLYGKIPQRDWEFLKMRMLELAGFKVNVGIY